MRRATNDRQALEKLCRYITRPALANERVQTNAAGQVVLKLKTAWRDGITHLVLSVDGGGVPADGPAPDEGPEHGAGAARKVVTAATHAAAGGSVPRAAGTGCARATQSRGLTPDRVEKPGNSRHG